MNDATPAPERWLPVPGYEGYYDASDQGRIRSRGRRSGSGTIWGEPFILKPQLRPRSEYLTVHLYRDSVRKVRKLHLVIAETFLGPRPAHMEVCHLNDDKMDNRVSNLYHGTHAQNMQDRVRNGRHENTRKTHCPQGHPYDEENTYRYDGQRRCRACNRIKETRRRAAARAAKR